jgi:hypothetical protein
MWQQKRNDLKLFVKGMRTTSKNYRLEIEHTVELEIGFVEDKLIKISGK